VDANLNVFRQLTGANEVGVRGSAHIEDIPFLFKTEFVSAQIYERLKYEYETIKIIKLLRTFFVNFVKFGYFILLLVLHAKYLL
jgi:hypothetical protein